MHLFLTPDEIQELTGIKRGKQGKRREALQVAALRAMRIPFHVNAVGRPVVARSMIEGNISKEEATQQWEPALKHG